MPKFKHIKEGEPEEIIYVDSEVDGGGNAWLVLIKNGKRNKIVCITPSGVLNRTNAFDGNLGLQVNRDGFVKGVNE